MSESIVVIGATGNVGGEIARRLLAAGKTVRAVARKADKLRSLAEAGAEVRAGSIADAAFLDGALQGAGRAFVLCPPELAAPDNRSYQREVAKGLASSLERARVKSAVSLSSFGAEQPDGTGPIAGLHILEEMLNAVPGLGVVHLRAAFFMENHLASIGLIKSAGVNGSTLKPDLPIPMIATRDIAARAADLLAKGKIEGRSAQYLLGPHDYTPAEATRILGASLGRPDLKYVQFPEEEVRKALTGMGVSPSVTADVLEMYRGMNSGRIHGEPRSKANTTPTTLEDFARGVFAPAFRR